MDTARALAVRLLMRSEESGYSNLLLKNALEKETLSDQDRRFVSALVYGTLEKQRLLDALLDLFLKKPVLRLDAPVRAILRSGLYQCRWMEKVPSYAAISAAVEMTRRFGKASAAGMVNAVLRKAEKAAMSDLVFTQERQRLAVLYSVSDPIAEMLTQAYPGQAEEILSAFETPVQPVLRVNTLRCKADRLCNILRQEGIEAEATVLPDAVRLPNGGDLAHTRAFAEGLFHVQGLASQLAALAVQAVPGQKIVDLCAAPGGKSLTLAQQMQDRGTLLCGELQSARVSLIEQQLRRCGVHCATVRCADATVYDGALADADAVLCDVPCSGTGTLAKKPDIRLKDLNAARTELTKTQRDILETASRYVRPGGRLVYSTCSLDPAENGQIVSTFLSDHPAFVPQSFDTAGLPTLADGIGVTIFPQRGLNDGFYIAVFGRNS